MSIVKETLLLCDSGESGDRCDGTYANGDARHETAARQRESAQKHNGWHRKNGKDYCPQCFAKLQAKS